MSEENVTPEQPEESNEKVDEAVRNIMLRLFPITYEKAILGVQTDDEREGLAIKFGNSPIIKYETIKDLFGYIGYIHFKEKREADAEVLLRFAKITSNVFLANKTQKVKSGISIQYLFEGKVIETIGHSLNEGITEWYTGKVMGRALQDTQFTEQLGVTDEEVEGFKKSKRGTYLIEVRLADKLIARFGEQLVGRAYFGGIEELEALMSKVDESLGSKAFIRLLQLSDAGNWREAFAMLQTKSE